jgi:hypothetical protein
VGVLPTKKIQISQSYSPANDNNNIADVETGEVKIKLASLKSWKLKIWGLESSEV